MIQYIGIIIVLWRACDVRKRGARVKKALLVKIT